MSMRPITLALALVLLALPALAEERKGRTRVSSNGLFSVRMVEVAPGRCRLEVSRESGPVWNLEQCLGTVDDFYFVSNDGERVWVVRPLVEKGQGPEPRPTRGGKKPKVPPAWANVPVVALYDRAGQRLQEKRLPEFVPVREMHQVRQLKNHFKWLEGTLGIPGKGPRLTDTGVVEFEPVGSKTHQLTF